MKRGNNEAKFFFVKTYWLSSEDIKKVITMISSSNGIMAVFSN